MLSAVATSVQEIQLDWAISADLAPSVASYRVLREKQLLATLDAATLTYADTSLAPSKHFRYTVEAVDASGKKIASAQSKDTQTPAKPDTADTLPPTEPEDFDVVPRADGKGRELRRMTPIGLGTLDDDASREAIMTFFHTGTCLTFLQQTTFPVGFTCYLLNTLALDDVDPDRG